MTATLAQRTLMPNQRLFYSPKGLFTFQADAVAFLYLAKNYIGVIDRGLGKTVIMMALACQLLEDDQIDLVVCVGQANKVDDKDEFPKDWAEFTSLRVLKYLGTGRQQRLTKALAAGPIDVLLTSYETGKLDLMTRIKKGNTRGKGGRADGPLVDSLALRDKRILWIFDEVIKFGNRGSELYQAYDYAIGQLRRGPHEQRVIGLSANPMSTDYVQPFNIGRIIDSSKMPSVTEWEEAFTHGRKEDKDRGYLYRKEATTVFAPWFERTLVYRKRDSDPDVVEQMPKLREHQVDVVLEPRHRNLYNAVRDLYGDWEELPEERKGQLAITLKILCGHPRGLLHANGEIPTTVVSVLGQSSLAEIPSSKTKALLGLLDGLQGAQAVVFTWWAETVLPELVVDLREAGYVVGTYTGQDAASRQAKTDFQQGLVQVLVTSDAGARGLNLPQARTIIEYEPAPTHEKRMQRFGRGTRITSDADFVNGLTMVSRETLEVSMLGSAMRRNDMQDHLLGDKNVEGYIDSQARKNMLEASRV